MGNLPVLFLVILLFNLDLKAILKLILKSVLNLILTVRVPQSSRFCFTGRVGV